MFRSRFHDPMSGARAPREDGLSNGSTPARTVIAVSLAGSSPLVPEITTASPALSSAKLRGGEASSIDCRSRPLFDSFDPPLVPCDTRCENLHDLWRQPPQKRGRAAPAPQRGFLVAKSMTCIVPRSASTATTVAAKSRNEPETSSSTRKRVPSLATGSARFHLIPDPQVLQAAGTSVAEADGIGRVAPELHLRRQLQHYGISRT